MKNGRCDDKVLVIRIADNGAGSFKASFGCFGNTVSRQGTAFAQEKWKTESRFTQNWSNFI